METTLEQVAACRDPVIDIAWDRGLAMRGSGIFLPLTITDTELDEGLGILRDSVVQARKTK